MGSTRLGRRAMASRHTVGRDPVKPGTRRTIAAELRQCPPGANQGVLQRVVGVVERAEHAIAVSVQIPTMRLNQLIKVHSGGSSSAGQADLLNPVTDGVRRP